MFTEIATGLIIVIAGLVLLVIAHRILRFAIKAAIALALIFVLLGGATVAWWQGWFSSSSSAPATQTNQRQNVNRRSSPR